MVVCQSPRRAWACVCPPSAWIQEPREFPDQAYGGCDVSGCAVLPFWAPSSGRIGSQRPPSLQRAPVRAAASCGDCDRARLALPIRTYLTLPFLFGPVRRASLSQVPVAPGQPIDIYSSLFSGYTTGVSVSSPSRARATDQHRISTRPSLAGHDEMSFFSACLARFALRARATCACDDPVLGS